LTLLTPSSWRLAGRRRLQLAAGDEDVDVATDLAGGGDGVEGGGLEALVVVFGDDEEVMIRSPWLRS
jgi:hypothetical protein